ncbi:hypothetical protein CAEBREN_08552 [Caenorhabditis brenneri]|uniref:Uncharacterized protein n=1 Tax=Caenorhabditis brenneri TaxID=135651 RepID=G0M6Y8_CAEBE|nr:hypothetical protein CAEBREN_08552 [Caenorhabditis brenneri]
MSKLFSLISVIFVLSESAVIPTRFRRQYGWGGSPYYGSAQYYETQPQQWSSQYQNNQYYSPYFNGYQRQQTWQNSNLNSYQSQYNRPSWISENNNGYATAPPAYNQVNEGGYGRPKYLATMQPKPTLSPVILERSTLFVTAMPVEPTKNDRHPTFLERLGVATLPIVPSLTSSEEESLKSAEEENETLKNGELLPERASEERHSEEEEETTTLIPITEETVSSPTEPSVMEKDEIASSEFFASSTENTVSSEILTTKLVTSTEPTTSSDPETTTESLTTTPEETTTSELTTTETTTTPASTTTTTEKPTTTTQEFTTPTTTSNTTTSTAVPTTRAGVTEVKPVTLLAFQEVTNEVTSNSLNVTQPTVDQNTSAGDLNVIGEGSGTETATVEESRPAFATGIVGLRAPPMPKPTDPEKTGLEVVEWTDSDNEVRKALLTQ